MTYQQVQYKGQKKNISISVIDNQEFVLLQDIHDIFPKITVLLSIEDNPIQFEMDDKGNRLLPLRLKAYSNDVLIGYSPDDSDTSDNSQGTIAMTTMTMVTKTKEMLLPLLIKLLFFLFIIGLELKSKFFPSSAEAAPLVEIDENNSTEIVEKKHNVTADDTDELIKMNIDFREQERCLNVQRPLISQEMTSFSNILEKGYVTGVTFNSSIGENKEATKIFSENLKVNSVLTEVTFNSPLRDDEIEAVTDALKENEKLESVQMVGVISDRTTELIANALKINKKIDRIIINGEKVPYFDEAPTDNLSMVQNKISDIGAKVLASVLQTNEKLESVDFSVNRISSDGAKYIAQALSFNEHVTSLDLSKNKISDDGAIAIAEALKINKSVTFLDLHGNQIADRGAKAIGEMLSQNTTLHYFHLDRNKISDIGAKHIEKGLCENKNLSMFWLSGNQISDSVNTEIHEKVSEVNKGLLW
ncbi:unnamed protein product [Didymodactylos carnosus]|uniref:Uncharacterized protein n=1 Tax=Didymodactylos carnosus TaxID=1234261 RepID=A0A814Z3B6_9BILA|nr:unnamed protein product [Didymodactylos carnosus]CAF1237025.1 unnamed protein product [Didymodactylos carnosus]CAF3946595.1 unnamed protein product [Didymodactylos carnosus]CAF3999403.1 unnamed protein product [Didymodactylos carnosus]